MASFTVSAIASQRLDEIFAYPRDNWGTEQAEAYIRGLFGCFDRIAHRQIFGRVIAAEFGVAGYYYHHDRHYIYWRSFSEGHVGIVTILHDRMHQMDCFREDI